MHTGQADHTSHRSWNKEKAAVIFLLKLLILLFFLKLLFYGWNHTFTERISSKNIFPLLKWSFENDLIVLLIINGPFFLLLALLSMFRRNAFAAMLTTGIFLLLNFACITLNLMDVFYFRFHLQRADADLLYVIQHPFRKIFVQNTFWGIAGLLVLVSLFYLLVRIHRTLLLAYKNGSRFIVIALVMLICMAIFFGFGSRRIIPTYPMVELNSGELQLVQNSFHTFLYSVYRKNESVVRPYHFMGEQDVKYHSPLYNQLCDGPMNKKKNVVLFIMESVPEDFFDTASRYKVNMPFLDSLLKRSTYFKNAYSYGHSSNKGIVSILAGIPTLTEIPLYHSGYASVKITPIGSLLAENGYTSSFFIGDDYDDFGFAKCCNWLGIQHYYSKESIPGYEKMESSTMGLHDGYVLNFMNRKINEMKEPFLAVNYNISTHYPDDLPENYKEKYPDKNFTAQMKCMNYYNECLQGFFADASKQPWFRNTVFIFCADHWMYPDDSSLRSDIVQGFHIPLFIYDPAVPLPSVSSKMVSQFDVLNTVLCLAAVANPQPGYGQNLLLSGPVQNRVIFSKENNNLYQAIDSSYVLGFNPVTGKAEFCYNYKTDLKRENNLIIKNAVADSLTLKIKAFLQTASYQYNRMGVFK